MHGRRRDIVAGMSRLNDAYITNVPVGSLMYPSKVVRINSKNGNYYLEDAMGFVPDSEIFPAVLVESPVGTFVRVLTPSGIRIMSKFSLVSYVG